MAKNKTELKRQLLQECLRIQNEQISAAKTAMDEAQESANEHHGAMEDKFESFREACQIQRDMFARQLDEAMGVYHVLKRINSMKENSEIMLGTVVETDTQDFFVSASLGAIKVADKTYFAISAMSPLFKAMAGKNKGESFAMRDKQYTIKNIY
ncbi:hypothetical protein [Adhaeribacter terreus]|uniref:Transcription elongation factor n=1 Tax=Adhaeribacter terreus TaxID=529703 RepID=A0ABW0E6K4_9BACT